MLIIETLRTQHQSDKAMAEAETAVKAYPKNQDLAIQYASMLGERGHVDEAVTQLQAFLTGRPIDRSIYISIAQIYLQAKHFDPAEKAIQKALDLSPTPEDQEYVLFVQASIFERQKKYDQAEETFKKVLNVDPLNASASNYLGYMLADRGVRPDESVKYIQKALELDPNNGAYLDSLDGRITRWAATIWQPRRWKRPRARSRTTRPSTSTLAMFICARGRPGWRKRSGSAP